MVELVLILWKPFLIVSVVVFLCQYFVLSRMITTKPIDFFIIYNISISVSIGYLAVLWKARLVPENESIRLALLYLSFLLGMVIASIAVFIIFDKKTHTDLLSDNEKGSNNNFDWEGNTLISFWTGYILVIAYKLVFGWILFSEFGSGDARLVLAKAIRPFDLFFSAIEIPIMFLSIYYSIKKRTWLYFAALFLYLFVSFFSGSKASILVMLLLLIFIDTQIGERKIKPIMMILLTLFGLISVLVIKSFWSGKLDIYGVVLRFVAAGDIYQIALVNGDYSQLIGLYNPILYILHPFTSLIGLPSYEYPIGSSIIGTMGYYITPNGPNPHLPILSSVLFGKYNIWTWLLPFFVGVFVIIGMSFGFRMYLNSRIDRISAIYYLYVFYLSALIIYLDLGLYIILLVKMIVGILFFMFLKEILRMLKHKSVS